MEKKDKNELERIGGQDALNTTRDFLEWYLDMLKKYEPYAENSINLYEAFLSELPCEINDVVEGWEKQ